MNNNKARAIAKIKSVLSNVRGRRNYAGVAYINTTGYHITKPKITGRTVTFNCDFSRLQIPNTLPRGFLSMEGRYAIKNPAIVRVTKSHGIVGTGTVNHWYIKTTNGFAIVHRTGKAQVTSPNTTSRVVEQLKQVGLTLTTPRVTKFDASMRINRVLNFVAITQTNPTECSYEPELSPKLYIKSKSPSMTLVVSPGSLIQILGASKPSDAVDVMRRVIQRTTPDLAFKKERYVNIGGGVGYEPAYVSTTKTETRNEKLAKLRQSKTNSRNPAFYNNGRPVTYNSVPPPGKYVRPGPDGKPRLYEVKGDMSLSAKKIAKAYEEAGVNMPQYVKNMLGSAFVFYGASKGAERAASYNAKKNGHYVAPGPGKQPHFYKLPVKNLKGGFATAKGRYNKAGVNMPAHVRNLFGVNNGNSPVFNRPNTHVVQNNRVNGTPYKKLTTAQLVSIARNLGNAGANSKMTKAALFERIKSRATIKSASPARAPNITVNGRVYIFSNDPTNQHIIRNGRKRVFGTLPKNERTAIMNRYFRGNNYKTYPVKEWYNVLRAYKGIRVATPAPSPASSPSTTNSMRNLARELENAMRPRSRTSSPRSASSSPNLRLSMPRNIP